MSLSALDNISWHALTGPQARFAVGHGGARRYAPGLSPIAAFADVLRPDFGALRACCAPDEHVYCAGWSGPLPADWRLDAETTMHQMVWRAPPPATDPGFVPTTLTRADVGQVMALVELTRPGPFGPRTIELGDYLGVFDGPRLVAMAGERMHAGALREISGVCTHPDFQGRGLARSLMQVLLARQLQRGETPFLHVMRDNTGAQRVYRSMGFVLHQERPVRVVTPRP